MLDAINFELYEFCTPKIKHNEENIFSVLANFQDPGWVTNGTF